MGEKIFEWIKSLATGEKRRFFGATIIMILIGLILIFPYIDANFLYYGRIEKRLDNLGKLIEISGETVHDSIELTAEYQSILEELSRARERTIFGRINSSEEQDAGDWVKRISGGLLFGIVGIYGLFVKDKGGKMTFPFFIKNNLPVFLVCGLFAVLLSSVFSKIPTLGAVWLNAVLAPVVQLAVASLLISPKKATDKSDSV